MFRVLRERGVPNTAGLVTLTHLPKNLAQMCGDFGVTKRVVGAAQVLRRFGVLATLGQLLADAQQGQRRAR